MPQTGRVLVTGATGFVGGCLTRELLMRGVPVRAMGRDKIKLAELGMLGAEPLEGDLRNRDAVICACQNVDTVFHVGALSSDWGRRADFEAVNVGGTESIIAGCWQFGVGKLVYVSSPSVLFDGRDQTNLPDDAPYPARFVSVYSETKARAEVLVRENRDVPFVIVRPKAIFGPGDTSLLPRLMRAAQANRLPQIGNGQNHVDLTYIDNVVHALLLAATRKQAVGNTYNITNGEPPPRLWAVIGDVLRGASIPYPRRRVGVRLALAVATLLEARARFFGGEPLLTRYGVRILARTQTYNIERARRDLNYAPVVSLAEGIARTIAAFNKRETGRV